MHKGFSCDFRRVPVAQSNAGADDTQLSLLTWRCLSAVLGQKYHAHVFTGASNGQGIRICKVAIHKVVAANIRDFRRAIEIGIGALRQCPAPDIQLLIGHHLAAERNRSQLWKRDMLQRTGVCHVYHHSRHPENGRNLLLRQKLWEAKGKQHQRIGN